MSRRGSGSSFSSNSDVNFDDFDDQQVFGLLEDITQLPSPAGRPDSPLTFFTTTNTSRAPSPSPTAIALNQTATRRNAGITRSRSPFKNAKQRIVKRPSLLSMRKPTLGHTSGSESEAMAALENNNVLVAALASLQTQVELLTSEKAQLEAEATTARTALQNLEQKLVSFEQSNGLFAHQLANMKESFQAKLLAREEEVTLDKMTFAKEKETLLQQQHARFAAEMELWKREIATLTKVKLDLEKESDRVLKELKDETLRRGLEESKHHALQVKYARMCEEIQQEKERLGMTEVELQELRANTSNDLQNRDRQCQALEERVNNLELEKEDQVARWERERRVCLYQNENDQRKLLPFVQEARRLHHLLQLSVTEIREHFENEVKKTKDTFKSIQQQANEFTGHRNDREVALISRKDRMFQLTAQLKSDRQKISQLETTLAKSTRLFEKKYATLKSKYDEHKEHLEITLAVRQGVTIDLQTKRKQAAELETEVARLKLTTNKTEVKLKHAQQQILALKKMYACELKKVDKKSLSVTSSSNIVQVPSRGNNDSETLRHDDLEDPDWREFVALVAAYEAERQLHAIETSHY